MPRKFIIHIGQDKKLAVSVGSYALTGIAATLIRSSRKIASSVGAYVLGGVSANLTYATAGRVHLLDNNGVILTDSSGNQLTT